jgi:hypothetical protein
MRFNCTSEEAEELKYALRNTAIFSKRLEIATLLSREKYMIAYQKYRSEYRGSEGNMGRGCFFNDLKECFPRQVLYDGFFYEPVTRESLIVHMLEIPFYQVPLYMNSKDEQVQVLTQWILKKGR